MRFDQLGAMIYFSKKKWGQVNLNERPSKNDAKLINEFPKNKLEVTVTTFLITQIID